MSGWPSAVRRGLHAFATAFAAVLGVWPAIGRTPIETPRHAAMSMTRNLYFIGPPVEASLLHQNLHLYRLLFDSSPSPCGGCVRSESASSSRILAATPAIQRPV